MITSIKFKNYKALRDAVLPLGRFNLIVGPNGSGKSTALEAFHMAAHQHRLSFERSLSLEVRDLPGASIEIEISWDEEEYGRTMSITWRGGRRQEGAESEEKISGYEGPEKNEVRRELHNKLRAARVFSFNPRAIVRPTKVQPGIELNDDGSNLAGVLDLLQGKDPEKFDALTQELSRWLPEFDRILFDVTGEGEKFFMLRTRATRRPIPAADLSHGTLIAVAFLTLAFLPQPPSIVCLEEPELFIHPRLLRDLADNMYRLSYPENFGDGRAPVQVIATTHSPYLLDHYKDHPEQIIIAEKDEGGAHFVRLSERADVDDVLGGASLGEVWYSGVLGGVPSRP
jgi:predicted ATPase